MKAFKIYNVSRWEMQKVIVIFRFEVFCDPMQNGPLLDGYKHNNTMFLINPYPIVTSKIVKLRNDGYF